MVSPNENTSMIGIIVLGVESSKSLPNKKQKQTEKKKKNVYFHEVFFWVGEEERIKEGFCSESNKYCCRISVDCVTLAIF
jgi:hypothetical protein